MTVSGGRSNEDFERKWREIAKELEDIPTPSTPLPPPTSSSQPTPTPHTAASGGPRDWVPASDDEVEELLAADDDLSYREVADAELTVTNPLRTIAWLAALFVTLLGIAVGIGIIPGSGTLAGALILVGFLCGAAAAFMSARHEDNPFDDGARI